MCQLLEVEMLIRSTRWAVCTEGGFMMSKVRWHIRDNSSKTEYEGMMLQTEQESRKETNCSISIRKKSGTCRLSPNLIEALWKDIGQEREGQMRYSVQNVFFH